MQNTLFTTLSTNEEVNLSGGGTSTFNGTNISFNGGKGGKGGTGGTGGPGGFFTPGGPGGVGGTGGLGGPGAIFN